MTSYQEHAVNQPPQDRIQINLKFRRQRDGDLYDFIEELLRDVPVWHRAAVLRREVTDMVRFVRSRASNAPETDQPG